MTPAQLEAISAISDCVVETVKDAGSLTALVARQEGRLMQATGSIPKESK